MVTKRSELLLDKPQTYRGKAPIRSKFSGNFTSIKVSNLVLALTQNLILLSKIVTLISGRSFNQNRKITKNIAKKKILSNNKLKPKVWGDFKDL